MQRIYLDHTATTPLDPRVFEAMKGLMTGMEGNPSSVHAPGREARAALDGARDRVAALLRVQAGEIVFLSGGTEADNFAVLGAARAMKNAGRTHVVTSAAEHHAVLEACGALRAEGFEVTEVPVDGNGMVDPGDVRKAVSARTALVSIMHANNEVGTVNPVRDIAAAAKERGALFHTDAVQSFGKIPCAPAELGADLLSVSAHKIYGPKGIGALYVKKGTRIEPLIHGGGQERGRRAGTESVALASGFAEAAELVCRDSDAEAVRLLALKAEFRRLLESRFPFLIFNGHPVESLPNILSVSFDSARIGVDGESLLFNQDLAGISASSGSACTSGSTTPSHVLLAMGRDEKTARATIRFSMGRSTTLAQIEEVVRALAEILPRVSSPTP